METRSFLLLNSIFKRWGLVVVGLLAIVFVSGVGRRVVVRVMQTMKGRSTVAERVAQFGPGVHGRLLPRFAELQISYPPRAITILGFKQERVLELWVSADGVSYSLLKAYPILGASGRLGPKLAEGDRQVPEGFYRVASLNPNSLFHLSLRIDYPNQFDREKAAAEGRRDLGADIMIHGKSASVGCLAMGDTAAEDLFVLVAETGFENVRVILSPVDFRSGHAVSGLPTKPEWIGALYSEIRHELNRLTK